MWWIFLQPLNSIRGRHSVTSPNSYLRCRTLTGEISVILDDKCLVFRKLEVATPSLNGVFSVFYSWFSIFQS